MISRFVLNFYNGDVPPHSAYYAALFDGIGQELAQAGDTIDNASVACSFDGHIVLSDFESVTFVFRRGGFAQNELNLPLSSFFYRDIKSGGTRQNALQVSAGFRNGRMVETDGLFILKDELAAAFYDLSGAWNDVNFGAQIAALKNECRQQAC